MIQNGTFLNVLDNSGAKTVCCIKVSKGYKKRYSNIGDVIVVSVKSIRQRKNVISKVKKGEVVRALIIRIKKRTRVNSSFEFFSFDENAVVLLNKQNKFIGTRVFGPVSTFFRSTRFLKIVSMSSGIIN